MALGSTLVEQPVTAEKAIALIEKAKAIVEADMGIKVEGGVGLTFIEISVAVRYVRHYYCTIPYQYGLLRSTKCKYY